MSGQPAVFDNPNRFCYSYTATTDSPPLIIPHNPMLIRPLLQTDIPALAMLMATTPLWQRYGVTLASATQRLVTGWAAGATIAVAEINHLPVGFVWYVTQGAFQRGGYIMLIGVDSQVRGEGIGQALMHYAEAALFTTVTSVFLLVSDFNQAAQRFYTRLGYQQIGAIPGFVALGVTELIFYKRQSPPIPAPPAALE